MNLIKRINKINPAFRAKENFPTLLDSFFNDDFFNFSSLGNTLAERANNFASANIIEKEDAFMIELSAPGLDKEDISISLENDWLTISHKSEEENEVKNEETNYMRKEFSKREFERSFRISDDVINSSDIEASMEKGILTLTLPKKEDAKPKPAKQIEIA